MESWPTCRMSHGFLQPCRRMLIACTETGLHSGARFADGLFKMSRDVGRTRAVDTEHHKEDEGRGVFEEAWSREKGINEEDVEGVTKNKKEMMYIVVFTVCTLLLPPQDCLKFLWLVYVEILSCIFMKGLTTGPRRAQQQLRRDVNEAQPVSDQDLSRQSLGRSNC